MKTKRPGGAVDWVAVRERLQAAQADTISSFELSPEQSRKVMDERARNLARAPEADLASVDKLELVQFVLGREIYALELMHVREIIRIVDYTPIPGSPAFLVGVINLRGNVLPIADLRRFYGAPVHGVTDLSRVIVMSDGSADLGVLADEVLDLKSLPKVEIIAAAESVSGIGHEQLIGITKDALIILNGDRLLTDARLFFGN